ncbi:glycosyltransferase [Facklamia hominis]|uniref:glycosyltransferase n=1 Tax=Facklamia hominis TaxID=178214 RepID=UPI0015E09F6C|nr:glycosyltransferase [Facklamia hominis]
MDEIKISVLMSVYNESTKFIRKSIESILNQTLTEFEFIIINDNPDDLRIKSILEYYIKLDNRIKIYTNERNLGLQKTLQYGVNLCKGKYIARMDADDICFPERLEVQLKIMLENDYDLVGLKFQRIDMNDNIITPVQDNDVDGIINKNLLIKNTIPHSSFFIKKSTLLKIGGYRNLLYAEDYDLILRIISQGGIIYRTKDILMQVRENPNGISVSNSIKQIVSTIYIKNLFIERIKRKSIEDSFTNQNQLEFIDNLLHDYTTLKKEKSFKLLEKAKKYKKSDNLFGLFFVYFKLILTDKVFFFLFYQRLLLMIFYMNRI